MEGMNAPSFDSSRAVDLSGLAAAAQQKASAPAGASGGAAGGAHYVVEATERTFEQLLAKSVQYPLVVEFYSPRANAQQLSDDLASLANAAGGKYLLVRLDVDANSQLAGALGIQAVPMVVGVVGGQLAPLFQGTADKAHASAMIDELIKVAVANGIVGHAEPVAGQAPDAGDAQGEEEGGPDPRFAAAVAAMAEGEFDTAIAEFEKILAATPGDADAIAGRNGARLLKRLGDDDPRAIVARAQADPSDIDAQLGAADVQLAGGDPAGAFARLIELVRTTSGDDRDRVRVRLLELFDTVGNSDPSVPKARRDLMTALF